MLLISVLIILFVVIVFVGVYVTNKYACSEKVRLLFADLKAMLLYNPLIRYTLLNCLKLNNTGMVVFIGLSTGPGQTGIGVFIVAAMTILPIVYAVTVYRKRKELNKGKNKD